MLAKMSPPLFRPTMSENISYNLTSGVAYLRKKAKKKKEKRKTEKKKKWLKIFKKNSVELPSINEEPLVSDLKITLFREVY